VFDALAALEELRHAITEGFIEANSPELRPRLPAK